MKKKQVTKLLSALIATAMMGNSMAPAIVAAAPEEESTEQAASMEDVFSDLAVQNADEFVQEESSQDTESEDQQNQEEEQAKDQDVVSEVISQPESEETAAADDWEAQDTIETETQDADVQEENNNLLENGGFENGDLSWWKTSSWCESGGSSAEVVEGEDAPEGRHYVKEVAGSNGGQIIQNLTGMEAGQEYWLTATARQSQPADYKIGVEEGDTERFSTTLGTTVNEWTDVAVRFTMWENSTDARVFTWVKANQGECAADHFTLVKAPSYSVLEKNILKAENAVGKTDVYTKESIDALSAVLENAQAMADKTDPANVAYTQDDVDAMNAQLQNAVDSLKKLPGIPEGNVTYYVDAENGNDDNDGTSPETAWKSLGKASQVELVEGGKILLKAGSVWNGEQLAIKGAEGTEENPIIIGKYGEGADPVINGQGSPWETQRKEQLSSVYLYNCSNIVVENLEVTNLDPEPAYTQEGKIPQSSKLLSGIVVENRDAGALENITIRNNTVHDVNGYMQPGGNKSIGGIIFMVTGQTTPSYYDGMTISGNEVYDVCHEAIYMESSWDARTLVGPRNSDHGTWYGHKDMLIENNYVHHTAGDGIVVINAEEALVQYNLLDETASEDWNYSANPAHAAIWMWNSDNVTMQYNESFNTQTYDDGMSFDFDYGVQNALYQYNYSHDNKGGFLMSCPGPYYSVNNVARYNISVNDNGFDGGRIIRLGSYGAAGVQMHNNTMYWSNDFNVKAVEGAGWGGTTSSGTYIYNNIFYGDSDTVYNDGGVTYDSNCVYGTVADAYPFDEDLNGIAADPQFVDANHYSAGSFENNKVTLGDVSGFKLKETSPCINSGRDFMDPPAATLPGIEDELVPTQISIENKDYYGNPAPYAESAVDMGAVEFQGDPVIEEGDRDYLSHLVELAESYNAEDFIAGYDDLASAIEYAKEIVENPSSNKWKIDSAINRLEKSIDGLLKESDLNTNPENILTQDQSSFENGTISGWSPWPTTGVNITVQEDTQEGAVPDGTHYMNLNKTAGGTIWVEAGGIPVKGNTTYVLSAWMKMDPGVTGEFSLNAKHHKDVAGGTDRDLGHVEFDENLRDGEWHQVTMEFATLGYETVSLFLTNIYNGNAAIDNIQLYEKYKKADIDMSALEEALSLTPEKEEEAYTADSWKAYQDAVMAGRLALADANTTAEIVQEKATAIKNALQALQADEDYEQEQAIKAFQNTTVEISAKTSDYDSATVAWKDVENADGYYIYYAEAGVTGWIRKASIPAGKINSYTFDNLKTGTEYLFTVKAFWTTNDKTIYTKYRTDLKAAPSLAKTDVTAAYAGGTSVQISWDKVSGANGYWVYRKDTQKGAKWERIAVTTANSYKDTKASYGKTYYYTAKAYTKVDKKGVFGTYPTDVTCKVMLAAPDVTAAYTGNNAVNVKWNKVDGASGYWVYRKDTQKGAKWERIAVTTANSYKDTKASYGKTYYYTAKAYTKVDKKGVFGTYPTDVTCKVILAAPDVTVSSPKSGTVQISWNKVEGATGYLVYRNRGEAGSKWERVTLNPVSSSTFNCTDAYLESGHTYYYTVKAVRTENGKTLNGDYLTNVTITVK